MSNKYVLAMLCIILLTSCSRPTQLTDYITNSDSTPPCWNNICPGKSSKEFVIKILNNMESVNTIVYREIPNTTKSMYFWNFKNEDIGGHIDFENNTAQSIGFSCSFNCFRKGEGYITLDDAIKYYGEPEYISFVRLSEGDISTLNGILVYSKQGIILSYKVHHSDNKVSISGEDIIDQIIYLSPEKYTRYTEDNYPTRLESGKLVIWPKDDWHGIGLYKQD